MPLHLELMLAAGMSEQPPLALLTLLRGLGSLVGISRGSAAGTLAATVQGDGVTVVDANSQVSGLCRSILCHACLTVTDRRPVTQACTSTTRSIRHSKQTVCAIDIVQQVSSVALET